MRLDHLVILVSDLSAAVADYTALGFQVTAGGAHADGLTDNALIPFRDGSYLELIAFRDPLAPQRHRWWHFNRLGGGLIDFALGSADLPATVSTLAQGGLSFDGPHPGGRFRPDGARLKWESALAPAGLGLPFLIDDVTERELRVPGQGRVDHPNGVVGIANVVVAVTDLGSASDHYATLLRTGATTADSNHEPGVAACTFPLHGTTITLAHPVVPGEPSALSRLLAERGNGIYAATLSTTNDAFPAAFSGDRTHGANLDLRSSA